MINKKSKAGRAIIDDLRLFVMANTDNIAFSLVMRDEAGRLVRYDRTNQPCYGEMRKYPQTHPDEYTDPKPSHSTRPSDLKNPFPKGAPEAVGLPFYSKILDYSTGHRIELDLLAKNDENANRENANRIDFFRWAVSQDSPWARGLGSDVEIVEDDKKVYGIILYDTNLDPTVLVNLMNCLRGSFNFKVMDRVLKVTSDYRTAFLTASSFSSGAYPFKDVNYIDRLTPGSNVNYYVPMEWNIRRFYAGNPYDLTGGTLRDRFDYNRRILHKVFGRGHDSEEKVINLYKLVRQALGIGMATIHREVSYEELVANVKQIVEGELVNV